MRRTLLQQHFACKRNVVRQLRPREPRHLQRPMPQVANVEAVETQKRQARRKRGARGVRPRRRGSPRNPPSRTSRQCASSAPVIEIAGNHERRVTRNRAIDELEQAPDLRRRCDSRKARWTQTACRRAEPSGHCRERNGACPAARTRRPIRRRFARRRSDTWTATHCRDGRWLKLHCVHRRAATRPRRQGSRTVGPAPRSRQRRRLPEGRRGRRQRAAAHPVFSARCRGACAR